MDVSHRTWTAAIKLAVVLSIVAAGIAIVATRLGDVPQAAIVIPVMIIAFAASSYQTGRIRRRAVSSMVIFPARRSRPYAT